MNNLRKFFIVLSCVINLTPLWAQENKIDVKTALQYLESRHEVYFSFVDKVVDRLFIEINEQELDSMSIDELLFKITQDTSLEIINLGNRQYVVRSNKASITYCAYVFERESEKPIEGALVYAKGFAVSGETGKVALKVKEGDKVYIQHIGYQPKSIELSITDKGCDTVYLDINDRLLSEVQVYNYLSDGIYKERNGEIVFVVDPMRMLAGMTEPDVLQSLKFLPGIQSTNESISELNIRGGTPDQNLILFNDVRIYQPGHFFGLISAFNPHIVSETKLIKEGTSAEYGDAASGVISISSENDIVNKTEGVISMSLLNIDGKMSIPFGKRSSWTLSGRKSLGDIVNTPTYESYFQKAFSDTEVTNANATIDVSKPKFQFFDIYSQFNQKFKDERSSLKVFALATSNGISFLENASINDTLISKKSGLDQRNFLGATELNKWWSKSLNTKILASFSTYNLDGLNNNLLGDQVLEQQNQVLDYQFKTVTRKRISTTSDVLVGYQGNNLGILNTNRLNNPPINDQVKRVLNIHSLFGELNTTWLNTDIRFGIRNVLFVEPMKFSIEPRLSVFKSIFNHFGLEFNAEIKSQSIFQKVDFQTDFLGIEKKRWFLEQESAFNPIISRQVSAGLIYNAEGFLFDAKFYIKDVNEISTQSQNFVNQFERISENGSYFVKGLDLLINYRFSGFTFWNSYSYMDNSFEFEKLVPPNFLNNTSIPHNLSSGLSYKNNHFDFSTGILWHIGRPYTTVTADSIVRNEISWDTPNGNRLPNFFRWDLSGQYTFNLRSNQKLTLGFSIWNVTNRVNVINRYFRLSNDFSLNRIDRASLPLTFNFVGKIQF